MLCSSIRDQLVSGVIVWPFTSCLPCVPSEDELLPYLGGFAENVASVNGTYVLENDLFLINVHLLCISNSGLCSTRQQMYAKRHACSSLSTPE